MTKPEPKAKTPPAPTSAPVRDETRRYERVSAQSVVTIYWQNEAALSCDASAIMRNVSAGGFGLRTEHRFSVGKSITVRTPERSLLCSVRHVQEEPFGYLVGLKILSSSDGSSLEESLNSLAAALTAIGRK